MVKIEFLKLLRESKGLSQQKVAETVGITRQMYNYIENGKRQPSVALAKNIASLLGCPWTKFFE